MTVSDVKLYALIIAFMVFVIGVLLAKDYMYEVIENEGKKVKVTFRAFAGVCLQILAIVMATISPEIIEKYWL